MEASNPIEAENDVSVEFPEIDPTVVFWLPRRWGYVFEAKNPICADNDVFVEFPKVERSAVFLLPWRWVYVFEASNPMGAEKWSNFPKSAQPPDPGCRGRGDTNLRLATPSEAKITFSSNSLKSTQPPVSCCLDRGYTNSKSAAAWGPKITFLSNFPKIDPTSGVWLPRP